MGILPKMIGELSLITQRYLDNSAISNGRKFEWHDPGSRTGSLPQVPAREVVDRSHNVYYDALIDRLRRRSPEDNFTERKAADSNDRALRQTLFAFANSVPEAETAVLFFGVDDKTGDVVDIS